MSVSTAGPRVLLPLPRDGFRLGRNHRGWARTGADIESGGAGRSRQAILVGVTTHRSPGLVATDHSLDVPLDHADPGGERITLFAREVVAAEREHDDIPRLVFLQGGPGSKSPRPKSRTVAGWLDRALQHFRVVLLDQRGTGRSGPVNRQTLTGRGGPEQRVAYLANFRADAIVRDAELLRRHLIGDAPWSVLGQSYGGFCALTYLSLCPEGLREVLIAGGLAPLQAHPDDIYRALYPRVLERNAAYFARYPEDQGIAASIVAYLRDRDVRLSDGGRLSPRRFQTLGMMLGMSTGFEDMHFLLEEAFVEGDRGPVLSDTLLRAVDTQVSFATSPLYAILHEPIYCQRTASRWSAHRVREEFPQFDLDRSTEVRFTGEMIYPFMVVEDEALAPLAAEAERLAHKDDWPPLYDLDVLAANTVPCAAAVYVDDMYVEAGLSLETAARVRGLRPWITNEHVHDGLRQDGVVFDRLLALSRGWA